MPAGVEGVALGAAEVEVPKRLVDGAEDAAPSVFCEDAPKLNKFDAGAVDVVFGVVCVVVPSPPKMFGLGVSVVLSVFCAVEPKPPNKLGWGAAESLGVSSFCAFAPKPLKMVFCAGAADCVEAPKLKTPLVAGVLVVF